MYNVAPAFALLLWPVLAQDSADSLRAALTLFNAGKYQESFENVSKYLRQNPNSPAAHKLLGMDEYMLGSPREALVEVMHATELAPKDPDAFYYLGRLYFSTDNAVAALAAFQKVIELDAASVRAYDQLGQTYEALGRQSDAAQAYQKANSIAYFRQALVCDTAFPEAKVKLAVALSDQERPDEALKLLEEVIQADPRNAEAHYRLALLLTKSGRREGAQQHFALFQKYRKP